MKGTRMTAQAASRARLLQLLDPAVTATGFDLEDVTVSPAGKRRVVRVVVDRDGGVDLDDVAEVARAVSDLLDADPDLLDGAYVLEVTSPGVDRPLTEPRHWRRAQGRLVTATLADETVTGRVTASTDTDVTLDVDGTVRTLLQAEVTRAVVQVEFKAVET
jgi:ribosome maturation factor RimP